MWLDTAWNFILTMFCYIGYIGIYYILGTKAIIHDILYKRYNHFGKCEFFLSNKDTSQYILTTCLNIYAVLFVDFRYYRCTHKSTYVRSQILLIRCPFTYSKCTCTYVTYLLTELLKHETSKMNDHGIVGMLTDLFTLVLPASSVGSYPIYVYLP